MPELLQNWTKEGIKSLDDFSLNPEPVAEPINPQLKPEPFWNAPNKRPSKKKRTAYD